MKYEHTVVLTAELTGIFDEDHTEDLSERFTSAVGIILGLMSIHVNILRCQDFIREKNVEEDLGDWISFDPEDQLTWPPLDELVLTVSKTGRYSLSKLKDWKYREGGIKWFEPNIGGVGPIDMMTAWHPLPEPFHMEQEDKHD